jgi:hypothetical protein
MYYPVPKSFCERTNNEKKAFVIFFLTALALLLFVPDTGASILESTSLRLAVSVSVGVSNEDTVISTNDTFVSNDDVLENEMLVTNHPEATESDIIYQQFYNTPIVNDEYRLIYFHVGKIASSEFKRFLKRLNKDPEWCSNHCVRNGLEYNNCVHNREANGLKYLAYDYSIEEVTQMMTSDEWTKAIFVRNPKPRLLSTFLDKAVAHKKTFEEYYCNIVWKRWKGVDDAQYCYDHRMDFSFFLTVIAILQKKDDIHFQPVDSFVDKKWWPYINFIGYMDSLSADSKRLFKSIKSGVDGVSAWERAGTTGWSPYHTCDGDEDEEFLQEKPSKHKTGAREHMMEYYTPELEKFVEKNWASDYENEFIHFPGIKLYDMNDDDEEVEEADRRLVDDGRDWWSV